jgi:hypothetical protein
MRKLTVETGKLQVFKERPKKKKKTKEMIGGGGVGVGRLWRLW